MSANEQKAKERKRAAEARKEQWYWQGNDRAGVIEKKKKEDIFITVSLQTFLFKHLTFICSFSV